VSCRHPLCVIVPARILGTRLGWHSDRRDGSSLALRPGARGPGGARRVDRPAVGARRRARGPRPARRASLPSGRRAATGSAGARLRRFRPHRVGIVGLYEYAALARYAGGARSRACPGRCADQPSVCTTAPVRSWPARTPERRARGVLEQLQAQAPGAGAPASTATRLLPRRPPPLSPPSSPPRKNSSTSTWSSSGWRCGAIIARRSCASSATPSRSATARADAEAPWPRSPHDAWHLARLAPATRATDEPSGQRNVNKYSRQSSSVAKRS
jgi:hypothetical protein